MRRPATSRLEGGQEDARAVALEVLLRVEREGARADRALGEVLSRLEMEPRDAALASKLVYGSLAWRRFFDHALAVWSGRSPALRDPTVRCLLHLGLYQLFFLDRVPDYAAVGETVEVAKRRGLRRATGFLNALLRRAAREGPRAVPLPDPEKEPVRYLGLAYSHPDWLVARWLSELGREETEALLRANNQEPPVTLRVNRLESSVAAEIESFTRLGIVATPTRWSPVGIRVEGYPVARLPGASQGRWSVQSEASQVVTLLVGAGPGERVLDACAGRGAKSTHLAEESEDRSTIVALDRDFRGFAVLRREAARLGLRGIRPLVGDASDPPFRSGTEFSRILVDAPCTGLGTLRRRPEIRWRRRPGDVRLCARRQRAILEGVAPRVARGGLLVYATCTPLREENEEVVEDFLRAHPEFCREEPLSERERARLPALEELLSAEGSLRTWPHRHGLDAFFAVRLRRKGPRGSLA
ncbi:MAG: ribosomal RNA small subunit methyltransferase B [Candidatus Binatia bacterium]|nr:MAG: ribosomal RNA small subunit methyltransferase B [Candidatus Binatia bacterium]